MGKIKQTVTTTSPVIYAVVEDAGKGTRDIPWTKENPKGMKPLGNRPVIQFLVDACRQAGIENIILVTAEQFVDRYYSYFNDACVVMKKLLHSQGKDDRYEGVQQVTASYQPTIQVIAQDPWLPYGNVSPLLTAKKYIENQDAFVVLYADDVVLSRNLRDGGIEPDIVTLTQSYASHPDAAAIMMSQPVDPSVVDKYGIATIDADGRLTDAIEKPAVGSVQSNLALYGRYLFTAKLFEYLTPTARGKDGELWTIDAIRNMIADGNSVYVEQTSGIWCTSGDPVNFNRLELMYWLLSDPGSLQSNLLSAEQLTGVKLM